MTQPRAADDFTEIRKRMEELRRTEGRHPGFERVDMTNVAVPSKPMGHYEQRGQIGIAGPAGNPTQPSPTGEPKTPKHAEPYDEDE